LNINRKNGEKGTKRRSKGDKKAVKRGQKGGQKGDKKAVLCDEYKIDTLNKL
jgi:hypothetical protein